MEIDDKSITALKANYNKDDPHETKNKLRLFFNWCKRVWTFLITVGVDEKMLPWERKRTRLLNGICIMAVLAYAGFLVVYNSPEERTIFWESFQAAIAYLVPIILNYYHRRNLACHFFCIYNLLCYSFFAISHGNVDAAEYFLLTSGVAAMLFFKSFRVIITYFILNMVFFWICKYSFTVMKPFLFMPPGENAYVPNHILLFVFSFLIVHYFRTENARQEGLLEVKNMNLSEEKQKSDKLLLNILPYETAE